MPRGNEPVRAHVDGPGGEDVGGWHGNGPLSFIFRRLRLSDVDALSRKRPPVVYGITDLPADSSADFHPPTIRDGNAKRKNPRFRRRQLPTAEMRVSLEIPTFGT